MNKKSFFVLGAFFMGACLLFFPLFLWKNIGSLDFWWWMSLNIAILVVFGFISDSSYKEFIQKDLRTDLVIKVIWGILSAVVLYGIFYLGRELSCAALGFAERNIEGVYSFKQGHSWLKVLFLMVLVIGPGEELFWRGFLQRHWQNKVGKRWGFLLVVLMYAGVHLGSGNGMLVAAAAVCGLFWGLWFQWKKSVVLVAVSHTVWDVLIFLLFPLS
ncbi:MAG: CPBP family intramembrane metalloprotease [Candidatus Aminicenantes bacterium]|nr:CPBP family intramembrane metalloprotease [Candidatus Aminicenantes bacterium]